jgi:peroxiredoxin
MREPDLTVVGIALDYEDPDKIREFAKALQVPYPILLNDGRVSVAYRVITKHPVTVIIDREGWIAYDFEGALTKGDLSAMVNSLL